MSCNTGRTDYCCRRATPKDIPVLVELLRLLTELEVDFTFDAQKHETGLKLLLAAPQDKVCILVAEVQNCIAGMCTGQKVISTVMGGGSVWVEDVVVGKEYRGLGIGRMLLTELQRWALEEAGASRIQLWADMDNKSALDFYQHTGWKLCNGIVLKKLY